MQPLHQDLSYDYLLGSDAQRGEAVEIAELEAKVNERWGTSQWDWTIGKCPEGWFFYCGTRVDPFDPNKTHFKHKGYAPTLTAALQAMLDIEAP